MADLACPACGQAMRTLALPRDPLAPLALDACDDCQALWLDATESQQFTPGALIALFRVIAGSHQKRRAAYPALLACPRCTTPLTRTQDLQRTTRFSYCRCRYGHGRFTPYAQFLLEKSFIRPLDPQELGRLRQLRRAGSARSRARLPLLRGAGDAARSRCGREGARAPRRRRGATHGTTATHRRRGDRNRERRARTRAQSSRVRKRERGRP